MRVLQIGLSSIMGGIESFSLNYFTKLSTEGIVFDYIDIYGAGIAGEKIINQLGGRVIGLPNFKRHPMQFTLRLTKILKKEKYDVVHINIQTAANILPVIAAHNAGIIPVVHGHTVNATGRLRALLHRMNIHRLRNIPAIHLACSQEAGEWLWGTKEFQIIPNAIDLKKYAYSANARRIIRAKLSVDDDTILLGYVGRLEPVKNPLYAVRILEKYQKRFPGTKIKLVVLGQGSLMQKIEEELRAKELEDHVYIEGPKSNVNEYLSAMDIFLMPSLHESLGLAGVEAQSNGLCCMFSDSISTNLRIIDSAVFLPLSEIDAWIHAINEKINHPNCGRIDATQIVQETEFNMDQSAQKLIKIYSETMKGNRN